MPQISHETGQWYVYPDLGEITKYTGVLRPVTLEHFRDIGRKRRRAWRKFRRSSTPPAVCRSCSTRKRSNVRCGRRSTAASSCSASKIPSTKARRMSVASTTFFEPKPYVTAAEFHEFCGPQVPLSRMSKRVWTNNETFTAAVSLANYGPSALVGKTVAWKLSDGERTVAEGDLRPDGSAEYGPVRSRFREGSLDRHRPRNGLDTWRERSRHRDPQSMGMPGSIPPPATPWLRRA